MSQVPKGIRKREGHTSSPSTDGNSAETKPTWHPASTSEIDNQPLLTGKMLVPAEDISMPPTSETDNQPLPTAEMTVPAKGISTPLTSENDDEPLLAGQTVASGSEDTLPTTATGVGSLAVTLDEEASGVCERESLPPSSESEYFPTPEK